MQVTCTTCTTCAVDDSINQFYDQVGQGLSGLIWTRLNISGFWLRNSLMPLDRHRPPESAAPLPPPRPSSREAQADAPQIRPRGFDFGFGLGLARLWLVSTSRCTPEQRPRPEAVACYESLMRRRHPGRLACEGRQTDCDPRTSGQKLGLARSIKNCELSLRIYAVMTWIRSGAPLHVNILRVDMSTQLIVVSFYEMESLLQIDRKLNSNRY